MICCTVSFIASGVDLPVVVVVDVSVALALGMPGDWGGR